MNLDELGNLFILYGLNVLYAIGLLVIGWWVATFVERLATRGMSVTHRVDQTVINFTASVARYAILVFVGVAVLQRFGIQTTSIIAALAIGLALQGTLANLAAGVMLLLFRPFRIGDSVEVGGEAGTVRDLSLFTTELASGTNVQVLIPNGKVWGSPIINRSAYARRRFDLSVELKPDADIEGVMEDALEFAKKDPRVQSDPAPSASISKMVLDRVEITFSGWASSGDAGAAKAALAKHLRARLLNEARQAAMDAESQLKPGDLTPAQ